MKSSSSSITGERTSTIRLLSIEILLLLRVPSELPSILPKVKEALNESLLDMLSIPKLLEVTEEVVQQPKRDLRKSKRNKTLKDFGLEFQLYLIEGTRDEKEAINDEMDFIMGNNSWVLVNLPPGCKPLGCKWIFKRKLKVDGTIEKFKARLVIQGFKQKSGKDYFDTYAPVARISTIRLLIAMASIHNIIIHQMDVKTGFLNGDLEEEVYMNQPQGFIMSGNENKCKGSAVLTHVNALQAKYDELQSEFGDQEAALTAHKLAVKKLESQLRASHKQQSSLTEKLNFQANQIFEKDEKLKKYRRIGMKAVKDKDALQKIVDSWFASSKNLWKLIDCGMSSTVKIGLGYGIKSNAEVLGYEEEISRGIFAFRETDAGNYDIPLYSRFKQVEYKGVPHPLSGDYTPREQEDIDDSLYEYGKYGPQPQSPSPTESDASSTVYSTCQSNDSDGELGAVSDHSVNDDPTNDHIPIPSIEQVTIATQKTQPQVPKPQQTVDPSCAQHVKTPRQPIRTPVTPSPIPSYNRQNWNQRMERDLGTGYSFERKPCFVCGSLSHLIKDCDYYEKKMAREAAFKSTRVVHANVRQATPAWTNSNRMNKANQFTPRPVQLNNIRPNLRTASNTIKTGKVNANTGHGNVSSVSPAGT
ncbi:zinc finger, CCHC-type containing protein [Tanacetum coccineum]